MIPPIFHYVWLGGGGKGPMAQRCMASWARFGAGFTIKPWTEQALAEPLQHPYCVSALKSRRYAFAADYCRFWILSKFGGVYLDTDIELVRDMSSLLYTTHAFLGYEDKGIRRVNAAVMGSPAGGAFVNEVLRFYDSLDGGNFIVVCDVMGKVLRNGRPDCRVFDEDFFYPFNPFHSSPRKRGASLMFSDITANTYAIHHWSHSWK